MKLYFVIDTDAYSGNFERELCAYITGIIGECGVGKDIANFVKKQSGIKNIQQFIMIEPDENGCCRPAKIYSTPNIYNNGHGFHYKAGEEKSAIIELQRSCMEQAKQEERAYAHDTKYAKQRAKEWIDKANNPVLKKYPAYQSVAIRLSIMPTEKTLKKMCQRARAFEKIVDAGKEKITNGAIYKICKFKITGFRLVKHRTVRSQKILNY
jgi:hypothetical protein